MMKYFICFGKDSLLDRQIKLYYQFMQNLCPEFRIILIYLFIRELKIPHRKSSIAQAMTTIFVTELSSLCSRCLFTEKPELPRRPVASCTWETCSRLPSPPDWPESTRLPSCCGLTTWTRKE